MAALWTRSFSNILLPLLWVRKRAPFLTGMRTKASWFFVKDNAGERGNSVWTAETGYGKMGNTVRV